VTSSAYHVTSRLAHSCFPLLLVETSPPLPFPIIKSLSIMIASSIGSSSTIQCKRENASEKMEGICIERGWMDGWTDGRTDGRMDG